MDHSQGIWESKLRTHTTEGAGAVHTQCACCRVSHEQMQYDIRSKSSQAKASGHICYLPLDRKNSGISSLTSAGFLVTLSQESGML